ncbi:MAG: hypothetical protein D6819_02345, partial [Gammaproteobacteria bacterium]
KDAGIAALAYEKRIPQEVFRYSPKTLALFLGRLWSTDGSIENTRISYSSSSQGLIDDLSHLLLRMGISTIHRSRSTSHRPNWEIIISDQKDVISFSEKIGPYLVGQKRERLAKLAHEARQRTRTNSIYAVPAEVFSCIKEAKRQSGRSWTQAGKVVGLPGNRLSSGLNLRVPKRALSRQRVALLGKAFASQALASLAEAEVLWDPIVEITPVGEKPVYDLEVPPFANFVAQDIVVHNSMGKKKPEEMAKQRAVFVRGAVERGVEEKVAQFIFDLMEKFAGYGFNRSHSAAYALLSYQTAWLKAHHPAEFMAAVLSSDMDNTDKVVGLLEECRAMGLEVLPPDINASDYAFTVTDGKTLRYGLGAIKGVGAAALEGILKARHAPFEDLFDFARRIDTRKANRRVIEALIRAGALDSFGERATLMANLPKALSFAEQRIMDHAVGQNDLFGTHETLPHATLDPVPDWSEEERLKGEKETLGFYCSGHPFTRFEKELAHFTTASLAGLRPDQGNVVVAGWVVGLRTMNTKRGGRLAFLTLDDRSARLEVSVFPEVFQQYRELIAKDRLLVVQGKIGADDYTGGLKVVAEHLYDLDRARGQWARRLVIQCDASLDIDALASVLAPFREGPCPVVLDYRQERARASILLGKEWRIYPREALLQALREQWGPDRVSIHY